MLMNGWTVWTVYLTPRTVRLCVRARGVAVRPVRSYFSRGRAAWRVRVAQRSQNERNPIQIDGRTRCVDGRSARWPKCSMADVTVSLFNDTDTLAASVGWLRVCRLLTRGWTGGRGHAYTFFRRAPAGLRAVAAMRRLVLFALRRASLADLSAEVAEIASKTAISCHERCRESAKIRAVAVEQDAFGHRRYVIFL